MPPRSRLFIVVPKQADEQLIQASRCSPPRALISLAAAQMALLGGATAGQPQHAARPRPWHQIKAAATHAALCTRPPPCRPLHRLHPLSPHPTLLSTHTHPLCLRPLCAQDHAAAFPGLEYCKTSLASTKGVVFLKFCKASAALMALEAISETSTVRRVRVCGGRVCVCACVRACSCVWGMQAGGAGRGGRGRRACCCWGGVGRAGGARGCVA